MSGVGAAWYIYMKNPQIADTAQQKFSFVYKMLDKKYWIDELYVKIFSTVAVAWVKVSGSSVM